ncbi:MAG TPA: serine/threonine-protein kinase, partial [Chthoniobacteraceae bacterium]|nr:serine/threonine-protein kinase [Chthoniobacteraceae bacterium]
MSPTTDSLTHCRCGAPLPVGWPETSCPRCLVNVSVDALDPARVFPPGVTEMSLGDYELLDEIARGGMGVVYRARQRRLERIVAVKVLAAGELANAEARRRFRVEAEAAARLQHPGIVTIHDVGESEGLPWLSMDFVAGGNLAALVREQPLPARQAADTVRTIAEAVQHAHDHGVLHRDLKPSNILLDPESGPRVTDFGIARCADAGEHTRTGEVLGSPGYTAPEQALSGAADARTDVYGLGALLYHLITARPPFQGPTLNAIMLQLRDADPLTPRRLNPAVPRDLETICLHCLRKNPANRYATARDVADDLARFLRGEPIHARPISAFGKTWRWCRRRPAIAALLAVVAVVAVLAFGLIDAARRNESAAKQRAEFASAQLRDANTRLAESLDDAELERAENLFQTGESADALALLARIVRRTPMHRVAAPRLASALWHGDFALPVLPPFHGGGYVLRMQFLRDGKTLL